VVESHHCRSRRGRRFGTRRSLTATRSFIANASDREHRGFRRRVEQRKGHDHSLAREALVLVPLGLPFFIPMAFPERLGLSFWSAFVAGIVLASATIGLWFWLGSSLPVSSE
jgi:hypothetical protein